MTNYMSDFGIIKNFAILSHLRKKESIKQVMWRQPRVIWIRWGNAWLPLYGWQLFFFSFFINSDLHFKTIVIISETMSQLLFLPRLWQLFWRLERPFSTIGNIFGWRLIMDCFFMFLVIPNLFICHFTHPG